MSYERVGLLKKVGYFVLYFTDGVCCHVRKARSMFDIKITVLLGKGQTLKEDQHKWILGGWVFSWRGFVQTQSEARQEWIFVTFLYWQPPSKVVALEVVFEVRSLWQRWPSPSLFLVARCSSLTLGIINRSFPPCYSFFGFWQPSFKNRTVS